MTENPNVEITFDVYEGFDVAMGYDAKYIDEPDEDEVETWREEVESAFSQHPRVEWDYDYNSRGDSTLTLSGTLQDVKAMAHTLDNFLQDGSRTINYDDSIDDILDNLEFLDDDDSSGYDDDF